MIRYHNAMSIGLFLLLAGCSQGAAVDPGPFPERPVAISVDEVDPCLMLDSGQKSGLGVRSGAPTTASVNGTRSRGCTWIAGDGHGYNAQTIAVPAALALSEVGAEQTTINGFGAVRSAPQLAAGDAPTCQVTIDAAPDRSIRVQARALPRRQGPADGELCRRATKVAEMVMTTVVRTFPG